MSKLYVSLLLVVVFFTAPLAHAQPLAEYVPADALFYAGWQGLENIGPEYEASHLKALLDEPQVKTLLNQLASFQKDEEGIMGDMFGVEFDENILQMVPVLANNTAAVFIPKFNNEDFGQPLKLVVLIRPRALEPAKLLEQVKALLVMANRPMMNISIQDGLIVVQFATPKDHDAKRPRLAQNLGNSPQFVKSMAGQAGKPNPPFIAYLNTQDMVSILKETAKQNRMFREMGDTARIFTAAGLDSVNSMVMTAHLEQKSWVANYFLDAPSPRKGLMAIFDDLKITRDNLEIIPQTATHALAVKMEPNALLDHLRNFADTALPDQKGAFEQILEMGSAFSGVNLQEDFIKAMGPNWVVYSDPAMNAGSLGMGLGMVNELADAQKMKKTLATIEVFITAMLQQASNGPQLGALAVFQTNEFQGLEIHTCFATLIAVSYTITDGKLFISLSPQDVVRMVNAARDRQNNITSLPAFTQTMSHVGGLDGASAVMFQNQPATVPQGYQFLMMWTQIINTGSMMWGRDKVVFTLPHMGVIARHTAPLGGTFRTDAKGVRMQYTTPYPGSEILAVNLNANSFILIPIAGIILQYSQHRVQAEAVRMPSPMLAQMIGSASMTYFNDHKKAPDIAELVEAGIITREQILARNNFVMIPDDLDELPADERASWVRNHSSFILVPGNMIKPDNDKLILVFERYQTAENQDMIAVFRGNGQVTVEPTDKVEKLLKEQTGQSMNELFEAQRKPKPQAQ